MVLYFKENDSPTIFYLKLKKSSSVIKKIDRSDCKRVVFSREAESKDATTDTYLLLLAS